MLIQVFLIGFAVLLLGHVGRQYKAQKVNLGWLIIWFLFSVGVVVVALVPGITDRLAGAVGVGRGADLVIYTSLALLFVAAFRHTVHVHRLEREMTELIRKIAVDNAEAPEKKDL